MIRAVLFAVAVVAACATPSQNKPGTNTAQGSGSDVVCHEVADTGTLFTHQECVPRDESDYQRDEARRFMKSPTPAGSVPNGGGGGH